MATRGAEQPNQPDPTAEQTEISGQLATLEGTSPYADSLPDVARLSRKTILRHVAGFAGRLLRIGETAKLRELSRMADLVESLEPYYADMTDAELAGQTDSFKKRFSEGESLDALLPEAFATVREASKRTTGHKAYHVQIMGAKAMHDGKIAEMGTGEGKTETAHLPAYLNAIAGQVHIATTNEHLAERDSGIADKVLGFLNVKVGCIKENMTPEERREQYAADVLYGTPSELGFDHMRDNMLYEGDELQGEPLFAIVDEADSILLDEAQTPLIISGPAQQYPKTYYAYSASFAQKMRPGTHYEVDHKDRTISMTGEGIAFVEDQLGAENLYSEESAHWVRLMNNALWVKEHFEEGRDFIVQNGEVLIIDEHTGRIMPGRKYNEGKHQAIEAEADVEITTEDQTLASVTVQSYFRRYKKLAGMTGTAVTEAVEFWDVYHLDTIPIPPNKPSQRIDHPARILLRRAEMLNALVEDCATRHEAGQPILIGTLSVEKSEQLAALLLQHGIAANVLNAKYHGQEARIIAEAGRKGAVTVATNMAGRGTDIKLGGDAVAEAERALREAGLHPEENPEEYAAAWPRAFAKAAAQVAAEHDEVVRAGGLYVVGTEHHESRRIDNQLRGRGGRQGDPSETRIYDSLDGTLLRRFPAATKKILSLVNGPIESTAVTNAIASAQSQLEAQSYELRKNIVKYDGVVTAQREVLNAERRRVLHKEADTRKQVRTSIDDTVRDYVELATATGLDGTDWKLEDLWRKLQAVYPVSISVADVVAEAGGRAHVDRDMLIRELSSDMHIAYDKIEKATAAEELRENERRAILVAIDRRWREQLSELEELRSGIHWRSLAGNNPLVAYQREGARLFEGLRSGIKQDTVATLFSHYAKSQQQVPQRTRQQYDRAA
ncbi:MAG TPA: preprotein translocase subunit SecA [Candidatus Saccharimonadales bacterium]